MSKTLLRHTLTKNRLSFIDSDLLYRGAL